MTWTAPDVTRTPAPSSLSLLGIVRHLVEVERWWLRMNAAQQSDLRS